MYRYVDSAKVETEQGKAVKSRFYVCHIEDQKLIVDSTCTRGTLVDQKERNQLFADFESRYNALLAEYHPDEKLPHAKEEHTFQK